MLNRRVYARLSEVGHRIEEDSELNLLEVIVLLLSISIIVGHCVWREGRTGFLPSQEGLPLCNQHSVVSLRSRHASEGIRLID